ncbi:thermonuclease family protein [Pseudomonas oryzihabitans]|uniref:thermonuclease family protein n=1 Tax=Pseudomonas oryzihabitans TaxID=47885 RepID=UPI002893BFA9|nr:thermonuclease family protein [Pseudomonas oryzihabitans]MDT3723196.1 thermonuclease family protein [Pseudomonas oryzihabitans]
MTMHLGVIARRLSLASILAASLFPLWAQAETITGRVVGISDGDTLTLLTADKRQLKVRLAGIDTPERAQPYGSRAQQQLSALAFGRQAELQVQDTDRYGRTVARVIVGGQDVNREMVREGAAWVYQAYNRDKALLAVEADARAQRRGLWALPEAERVAPWDWRKTERTGQTINLAAKPTKAESSNSFSCSGGKKYCKEMSSCAEARFYLEQCGMSRLDRDKDGIPCENVCGG